MTDTEAVGTSVELLRVATDIRRDWTHSGLSGGFRGPAPGPRRRARLRPAPRPASRLAGQGADRPRRPRPHRPWGAGPRPSGGARPDPSYPGSQRGLAVHPPGHRRRPGPGHPRPLGQRQRGDRRPARAGAADRGDRAADRLGPSRAGGAPPHQGAARHGGESAEHDLGVPDGARHPRGHPGGRAPDRAARSSPRERRRRGRPGRPARRRLGRSGRRSPGDRGAPRGAGSPAHAAPFRGRAGQ